jgi:hypothetical protein
MRCALVAVLGLTLTAPASAQQERDAIPDRSPRVGGQSGVVRHDGLPVFPEFVTIRSIRREGR